MKRLLAIIFIGLVFCESTKSQDNNDNSTNQPAPVRFAPLAVYIDTNDIPLAAYQFELNAVKGEVKIVGVEGSEVPAFREAPYYDPAALMHGRIIIAAFSTAENLPQGKIKAAVLHLQITGTIEPEYSIKLITAANADGQTIPAEISIATVSSEERTNP